MPLMVMLNDQVFKDGDTIKSGELFQGMREGKVYKTSQASVGILWSSLAAILSRNRILSILLFLLPCQVLINQQ